MRNKILDGTIPIPAPPPLDPLRSIFLILCFGESNIAELGCVAERGHAFPGIETGVGSLENLDSGLRGEDGSDRAVESRGQPREGGGCAS